MGSSYKIHCSKLTHPLVCVPKEVKEEEEEVVKLFSL
jgi:hypothetical protein